MSKPFAIGIPSFGRAENQRTAQYLKECGVPKELVTIQTQTQQDFDEYSRRWGGIATVRYAQAGSAAQNRNNLLDNLQKEFDRVLLMDDDVTSVRVLLGSKSVDVGGAFIECTGKMFDECDFYGGDIFGAYPLDNPYFQKHKISFNRLVVGCFMGINKRGLRFDESIGVKDDWELCCRLISSGRIVLRFDKFSIRTEYGKISGGCKKLYDNGKGRVAALTMLARYPKILRRGRNDSEVALKKSGGFI